MYIRGTWVAQEVERPTSAQVMISRLVSSSPASGSGLTAQILEPASDSGSLSLSTPLPLMLSLPCLSKIKRNIKKNFFKKERIFCCCWLEWSVDVNYIPLIDINYVLSDSFCLLDLSISNTGVLKSPTTIMGLPISP